MVVKQAIPCNGFDINQQLIPGQAAEFKSAGMEFCIRYIPRTIALIKGNLTIPERDIILNAGLSLMVVQHVTGGQWEPNVALGKSYGSYAVTYCEIIGLPKGMNIWLDMETPASNATAQECIDYANSWYDEVIAAGYIPGIYLGYGLPMSPAQLHSDLKFSHYWRAYNGPDVATRGYQIVQKTEKTLNGIPFDPNTLQADELGDLPIWLSPT